MARSFKEVKAYSKKVIPPLWSEIIVPDPENLCFLGETNLKAMLFDWQIIRNAREAKLRHLENCNDVRSTKSDIKEAVCGIEAADFAINAINSVLPKAQAKPLFARHRSVVDAFSPNEDVYIVLSEEKLFIPATVIRQALRGVLVSFDSPDGNLMALIDYDSPVLLRSEDLKYLGANLDYLELFALLCGFRDKNDIVLYINNVIDSAKIYFSENELASKPDD